MLGGAIAAREGRLLALSALTTVLPGRREKTVVTIFSQSFAAAVSAFLCVASVQFVVASKIRLPTSSLTGSPHGTCNRFCPRSASE